MIFHPMELVLYGLLIAAVCTIAAVLCEEKDPPKPNRRLTPKEFDRKRKAAGI